MAIGTRLAGQGLEPAEMRDPFGVGQGVQTHARRRPVVADPQDGLREIRRRDGVAVFVAQIEEAGIGAIGGGDGHPVADAASDSLSATADLAVEPAAHRSYCGRRDQAASPRSGWRASFRRESGPASVDNLTPRTLSDPEATWRAN
jgi:hypothetical protein